jgi:hypothetical protein
MINQVYAKNTQTKPLFEKKTLKIRIQITSL